MSIHLYCLHSRMPTYECILIPHMSQIIEDLVDVYALVYLDNTLIFSHTEEEYQKHICMTFDRVAKFKYYVKCKKCELFSKKFEFLGHTILAAGVGIVLKKANSIKQ